MRVSGDARQLWMWMWNDAYANVRNEAWMASRKPEGLTFVNIAWCTSELEELLKADLVRQLTTNELAQLEADQPPTNGVWDPDVDDSCGYEDYSDPDVSISDSTQAWLTSALERLDAAYQNLMASWPALHSGSGAKVSFRSVGGPGGGSRRV